MSRSLLETFDPKFIRYAFRYGSSAFKQSGYTAAENQSGMLDLMIVTRGDPFEFHKSNLERNRDHYSRLVRSEFGQRRLLQAVQDAGAGVFFNTDVKLNGQRAKYGIVSDRRFRQDLTQWDTLYLAGRLHKPVGDLIEPDAEITEAKRANLIYAFHAGILLLTEKFTRTELLEAIVSISYLGDIRRLLAENPNKVRNIVQGQGQELWKLYEPLLDEVGYSRHLQKLDAAGEKWSQDFSLECRNLRLLCIPNSVKSRIGRPNDYDVTPVKMRKALADIARWPSVVQSFKGVLTADPSTSTRYLLAKIAKRFK